MVSNDRESGDARSKHHRGTTMNHFVGIDVSLEAASVCVVDGNGKIVREGKIASEPDALIAWLKGLKLELMRIGLICCGQIYVVSTEASQGRGISLGSLRNIAKSRFPSALVGMLLICISALFASWLQRGVPASALDAVHCRRKHQYGKPAVIY
jgi:hypothetical protein